MKRLGFMISVLCLVSAVMAGPVLAAAPGNDAYAGREAITSLPFAVTADTTEATTDSHDTEVQGGCGAPVMDASVWYELSPALLDDHRHVRGRVTEDAPLVNAGPPPRCLVARRPV